MIFAAPSIDKADAAQVESRIASAFAGGQNLYVADFFELASVVFALGGEPARRSFLKQVGRRLDEWTTQPMHRKAWKSLLESV